MKRNNLAEIAATKTQEKRVLFSLCQRLFVTNLLGRQTGESMRKILGRDITEDEWIALYNVRRKVKATQEELAPFTRRLGAETTINLAAIQALSEECSAIRTTLDNQESRLLKSFLQGWLKIEGQMADRDWAAPLISACGE